MVLTALVVEVHVRALLIVVAGDLGLFVPLEPGHVLLVKPPRLLLELLSREELLVAALLVVEGKEQGVGGQSLKQRAALDHRRGLRGERVMRVVLIPWSIPNKNKQKIGVSGCRKYESHKQHQGTVK